ncbi:MAG: haloalkane dehalogenase [Henriciella sp.]|nr:haloalkane dehalogenase [Henriciella sp.]
MPAYFVVSVNVRDRERFKAYQTGIVKTMKPFGGWILAAGPGERLEGGKPMANHNVIIQFPTTQHCKDWWDSSDYRDIVPIRLESTDGADPYVQAAMSGDKPPVSGLDPFERKSATINGLKMAYIDEGEGDPIVFLHGNPTSSYLWRNIIPYLVPQGRCIAPDLIGMGESDKLPNPGPDSYRFVEHRDYLEALLGHLGVKENVTLVIHDWGSALGFDWANRHRDAVAGIGFTEALVRPMSWETWPQMIAPAFKMLRSEGGEAAALEKNFFVETMMPASVMRKLGDAELNAYRRPFRSAGEDRRPTLTWPREIPFDGEPADTHQIMTDYSEWLATSDIPKLFINAEPGAVLTGEARDFVRTWSNLDEVTVAGLHYVQEDSPDEMGAALAAWRQDKVMAHG